MSVNSMLKFKRSADGSGTNLISTPHISIKSSVLRDVFDKYSTNNSSLSFENLQKVLGDIGVVVIPPKEKYTWGYEDHNGCHTWGHHFSAACGNRQSPININQNTKFIPNALKVVCKYPDDVQTSVFNNGHTVQWLIKNSADTNCELLINGQKFKLVQFHFHVPTEHTFDGKQETLEIHFVHAHMKTGELAVMGFLFEADDNKSKENPIFDTLKKILPLKQDDERVNMSLNLNDLEFGGRWCHYDGSLTTPPCSEGVRWFVNLKKFPIH